MVNLAPNSTAASQAKLPEQDSKLYELLTPCLESIGYDLVQIDVQLQRPKTLRLYIDFLEAPPETTKSIGIQDCVKATKYLDPFFESDPAFQVIDSVFGNQNYELEISSPGVERPLRREKDFLRFKGETARIHLLRPLQPSESGSEEYCQANPRQKNFKGALSGFEKGSVLLTPDLTSGGALPKSSAKGKKSKSSAAQSFVVRIPLGLIAKAHLEPSLQEVLDRRANGAADAEEEIEYLPELPQDLESRDSSSKNRAQTPQAVPDLSGDKS